MVAWHLINVVRVANPRFHDRVILPKADKFKPGWNVITVAHKNWPGKYAMHSDRLLDYPTETKHSPAFGDYEVYAIPLTDLQTIQEYEQQNAESNEEIRRTIESFGWWTPKETTDA